MTFDTKITEALAGTPAIHEFTGHHGTEKMYYIKTLGLGSHWQTAGMEFLRACRGVEKVEVLYLSSIGGAEHLNKSERGFSQKVIGISVNDADTFWSDLASKADEFRAVFSRTQQDRFALQAFGRTRPESDEPSIL